MDQILSVCTGIGGLDLGLHAGLRAVGREARTVCMVEREAFPCAVLGKAIEQGWMDDAPLWLGDLRELPLDELPAIDWYTGGYPCQPWSQAGKRLGEDDPRHLWPVILKQIKSLRPRGVFFENVGGHLSLGLDRVLQDLAGCGFRCAFGLFTAEEVGAPHRRERVFILGLADPDSNTRGPRESRRTSGEVQVQGDRLRGGASEGQARQKSGSSSPNVADSNGGGQPFIGQAHDDNRSLKYGDDADRCGQDVADSHSERLERNLSNLGQEGRTEEGGSSARCREHRGGWRQVVHIGDCTGDHEGGECFCPCGIDYIECRSPGPTQDGIEYAGSDGILYGRPMPWRGWPSRPGEPQHDWEPPRVVAPMGRSADGLPDRVDRLRALGNAVVPQQAAKAFVTLYKELEAWTSKD